MNVGIQPKTKEIFERFHDKIEQVLESKFTMSYNPLDDETRIYYNSNQNSSNFKMVIFEENENKYVPNTLNQTRQMYFKDKFF